MDTLIRIKPEELNNSIIDFIKSTFKGKRIAVHIYEDEMDETEYLLSDPVAKQRLLESIEDVKHNRNLKECTIEELQQILNVTDLPEQANK